MTIAIAFTGPARNLSGEERALIRTTVQGIEGEPDLFLSGAARGVDTTAAHNAIKAFPHVKHRIIIPRHNGEFCPHDVPSIRVIKRQAEELGVDLVVEGAPSAGRNEREGYMIRNDTLALNCTHMLAFPETSEEEQYSGTWATIRRAKKLGRPIKIVPLDGEAPYTIRNGH